MPAFKDPTRAATAAPARPSFRPRFSITLRHVTVALPDGRVLLDDLNESFHAERTGLVGRNGTGKSLLARAMLGRITPDRGQVLVEGALAHVPQAIAAGVGSTLADVAGLAPFFEALARIEGGAPESSDIERLDGHWDVAARWDQALHDGGLPRWAPGHAAAALSGGELTRVALIGALLSGADGLVLDEPTNHLDRAARQWLLGQLRRWPGGLVVISHDRELLEAMDRIVELTPKGLQSYRGNYTHYVAQREAQSHAANAALAHARTERRHALQALRQQHDDRQRRAARNNTVAKDANLAGIYLNRLRENAQAYEGREQMRQQESRAAHDRAVRDAFDRTEAAPAVALMLPAAAVAPSKRVLSAEGAVPPFPAGTAPLDLALTGPVRVAIKGPNGCGKTTLLKMLAGRTAPLAGTCQVGVPSAWLDQHSSALLPAGQSVLARLHELDTPLPEGELRSHLALLGLKADQVHLPSSQLSGGERLKAALGCALWRAEPAQLLLLDEPTNHLDLDSVRAIEQALASYPGAMLVVSHDEAFLSALRITHTLEREAGPWKLSPA